MKSMVRESFVIFILYTFPEFGNHSDETQAIMVQVRVRVNNLLSKNVPVILFIIIQLLTF